MSSEAMTISSDLGSRLERLESAMAAEGSFDLLELLRALWHGKWFIGGVTGAATAIALAILLNSPNIYRAEILLIPAASAGSSSLTGGNAPAGGLASLAGLRLGRDKAGDKATYAMELLKTWGFLEKFVRDNQLEVPLMAGKRWDRNTGELLIDPKRYDVKHHKWVRKDDTPDNRPAEPTGWAIYNQLKGAIDIDQDKNTGVISVAVTHLSPVYAKEWAEKLVVAVNQHMQAQDQNDARRNIDYLQKQINGTALTDMQKIFYSLIEEQTKNLMLAEASDEYALKTLSPAQTPEVKFGPKRALDTILAALFGLLFSVLLWLTVLHPASKRRHSSGRE